MTEEEEIIEDEQDLEETKKIKELKNEIKTIRNNMKINKLNQNRKLRVKNENGKSNVLTRVSHNFSNKLEGMNDKREENGFDRLSNPKITELIIKHKSAWKKIERDIVFFNTNLEIPKEDGDFKDDK